jgi:hypothetical protein
MRCVQIQSRRRRQPLHAAFLEFFVTFVERDQLRRANEGEVHRPEEQNGRFTVGVLFEVEFSTFLLPRTAAAVKSGAGRVTRTI